MYNIYNFLYINIQIPFIKRSKLIQKMHDPFPTDSIIELTQQLSQQLIIQRKTFDVESKKSDQRYTQSSESTYYIISTKFLQEWKKMTDEVILNPAMDDMKRQIKTPGPMNIQLVQNHLQDFNEYQLKRQIQQGIDFLFYNNSGAHISRRAYWSTGQKKIQMYPIQFQFVYMSKSWIELIKKDQNIQLPVLHSLGYKNQTILDLSYKLVEYSRKDPRNKAQMYKHNAAARLYLALDFDPQKYVTKLRQQQIKNQTKYQKYDAPGILIKNDKQIGELQVPKQKFTLIVQLQQDKWVYKQQEVQRCEFCRDLKKLPVECRCKQVRYCSNLCKQKDWRYHARTCDALYQQDNIQPQFNIKQNSKHGLVGLSNLGNTCYMNAALQCMLHTRQLTEYIKDKKYIDQINYKNPIGSQGKLIKAYAKFIQACLTTQDNIVTPTRLKYTVGKVKDMFSGFEQHDSQQFLLFMLDTLHEDLNRVLKKPFTEGVENQGRPDQEVAKESWITYLKRNQSIVNDLMGGQYRSEVKCPDCHRISVTFDPYLIFAVPIPSLEMKQTNLYYFMSNYNAQTVKITLSSQNNLVKQLIQDLANKTKTQVDQILFFISGFNGIVRRVNPNQTVDKITNEKQLNQGSQQKQLFAMQFEKQQLQNLQQKKWLIFKFITKSGMTLTFKRPFPMKCKNLKGSALYDRMYEFLLNIYTKSDKKAEGKQRQTKLNVYKTKVQQENIFKIFMVYGKVTEFKNRLTYEKRLQVQPNTDISQLLEQNNFQVQFQVQFSQNPYYSFNSYKTYSGEGSNHNSLDHSESIKSGSDETYTLYECLQEMKKSQKLLQGNQVFCSHCKDLKLAQKKMELYKSSKYLIMQLRRFKQVSYQKTKNYALVKFPDVLDLSQYLLSPKSPQNYFKGNQQSFIKPKYWQGYDQSTSTKYKLYGVVNHHGSLAGGHYTAFATDNDNKWFKFDDSDVTRVQVTNIVSSAAYLLFYERID